MTPVPSGVRVWVATGITDMYTLIITAKLNGVDPRAWLADVLRRIPGHPATRLHELLPWNWNPPTQAAAAA